MTTPDLEPTQRIPIVAEAQPGYAERPTEQRPSPLAGLLGVLLRVVLVVLLALGALVAAALLFTPTRESVLILGSDARPDEIKRGEVGRTDTLLLFVGDRATPRTAMVSVPRDLWVPIPGHGQERINAAFELGGSQAAMQTVGTTLGQRVDRFALIGLQGVRDVVDAVGGIDITVPQAIHDDSYPTDDYGYQTVDIPAGPQHMDGDTALKYARTRHQDSDFARIARQQQVLLAVRNAMINPVNWPRTPALIAAVNQALKTDMTPLDAIALGAAILRDPTADRLVIDTSLVREVTGQDGAYLLEPKADLKPAVARFLASGSAPTASVEVLNGAGVAGLAARTAEKLAQAGFVIANVGDAPRAQAQTTIVARESARSAAERIASSVGLPASRVSTTTSLNTADIQIILGADARGL